MPTNLDDYRRLIETTLDDVTRFDLLDRSWYSCPPRLQEAIRYSLLAPGKRIRSIFTLLATELCNGNIELALPAACAVEMVHTYSLIHDDLPSMDNDDLRRGRPTCHKRFDEATAILAGDALLTQAFEMLCQLPTPDIVAKCCRSLAHAAGATALVGGQMDDIAWEKDLTGISLGASEELIKMIHRRKTAALIRVAFELGGIIANATVIEMNALRLFGESYGLAFQITDDLLDVRGDEETVGKRLRKDARLEKCTYPSILGIQGAEQEAERIVTQAVLALEQGFPNNQSPPMQIVKHLAMSIIYRQV